MGGSETARGTPRRVLKGSRGGFPGEGGVYTESWIGQVAMVRVRIIPICAFRTVVRENLSAQSWAGSSSSLPGAKRWLETT